MKHHNNRKSTLGRNTQVVSMENGKSKTIRHETINAISRKTALFNFWNRLEILQGKWYKKHPEYRKKIKEEQ